MTKTNFGEITLSEKALAEFLSKIASCLKCPAYAICNGNCADTFRRYLESASVRNEH